jgi:hypothetical protein
MVSQRKSNRYVQNVIEELVFSSKSFNEGDIYDFKVQDISAFSTITGKGLNHIEAPHEYRN